MEPTILQRSDHSVSRKNISRNALAVLSRLNDKGYKAYLVGGCVRDLMLGFQPKDFDVVTDATPKEVRKCFRNCRLIGRRFRLAHIMFKDEIIEVATFRALASEADEEEDNEEGGRENSDVVVNDNGVVVRDNEYGTPEEDAFRRDFTVNALFYDIDGFTVIDYVGGLEDLKKKRVAMIGDPDQRYQEDPVRMIRAVRFASTLDLTIEENTYQAILRQRGLMAHASHARMYEEILKFFYSGALSKAFDQWVETGLLDVMFPGFAEWYREEASEDEKKWHRHALEQLDKWKANGVKASQELAYGLFLLPFIRKIWREVEEEKDLSPKNACQEAVYQVQRGLSDRILIPKRIHFRISDLLFSQRNFQDRRNEKRVSRFLQRPYFRDALVLYKFDCLASNDPQPELIEAWTEDLKKAPPPRPPKAPPRRRKRRRKRRR